MTLRCVDLFAGWGGFSLGARMAGARVVWAANHWPLAVEAHRLNHPGTIHACQDLQQADWSQLPELDVVLASPACQGHSRAAQPSRARSHRTRRYHDALRATAWAVIDCVDVTEPRAVVIENTIDFLSWKRFPVWRGVLEQFGYRTYVRQLVASRTVDVPQRRKRVFVVAVRGRKRPGEAAILDLPERSREPAFGPHLQRGRHRWSLVADATPRVRERVDKGRRNHGRRFLSQHVTGHPGVALCDPIRTITTKDQWILVDGDRYRGLTIREHARAMGFPDSYRWPEQSTRHEAIMGLGNAVPPQWPEAIISRLQGVL